MERIAGRDVAMGAQHGSDETQFHGASTTTGLGRSWAGERRLERGTLVDRYVIVSRIGAGGMGVVYSAYDPELDRKIALKLLRHPGAPGSAESRRLLREAQALARLAHPNVVAIHDVGTHQGQVWLAMEFVSGSTLRVWLGAEPRGWRAVREVLLHAAAGVAAAHEAGLCHRDLKPANIMVGDDGRVRVMDFGLARGAPEAYSSEAGAGTPEEAEAGTPAEAGTGMSAGPSMDPGVTGVEMMVGTPAYMAPERFSGYEADPRSDQFSLCVTAWEALFGERPFAGDSPAALEAAMLAGPPRQVPPGARVPRWLRRACERGLAPDPDARWPSVEALREAMARDPALRRARGGLGLGAIGLAGLAVAGTWWSSSRVERPCTGAREHLAGTWDAALRERAHAAVLGTQAPHAPAVWAWAEGELSRYADRWVDMHTQACEATSVRGEQSAAVMDLRMGCLERARVELRAVGQVLVDADAPVLDRVEALVEQLLPLSRCADVVALQADVEPPLPEDAEAVRRVRSGLAQARAARVVARLDAAEHELDALAEPLRGIGYEPVHTEVLLEQARLLDALGRYESAEARAREAMRSAARLRQWDELRAATGSLIFVVGYRQQRVDEALGYAELAEGLAQGDPRAELSVDKSIAAVLQRKGEYARAEAMRRRMLALEQQRYGPEHPAVAAAHLGIASALVSTGAHAQAEDEARQAIAIFERAVGPLHPDVASARYELATVLTKQGRYGEAEDEFRRVVRRQEQQLGPAHPEVAISRDSLAAALFSQGKYAEAEAECRRALTSKQQTLGLDHPATAISHNSLGNMLSAKGDDARAEEHFRRALAIWEQRLGPDHVNLAAVRTNLALSLAARGRYEEAVAESVEALAIWERVHGPEHPDAGNARGNLGHFLMKLGRLEEAIEQLRLTLATWEATLDPDHPRVAQASTNLARALLVHGDAPQALPLAERGWDYHRQVGPEGAPVEDRADAAFVLARVLWATGPHVEVRARVRSLAEEAASGFTGAGAPYADEAAEVVAWQRAHR